MVLYIPQHRGPVNGKRLRELPRQTRRRATRDKICPDSISPTRIEAALNSGQRLKAIWKALRKEGLQITYRGFHMTVSRARKMRASTAADSRGKQSKSSEAQALAKKQVETVEERDPLANLKLLEENRPGFRWRGAKSLNALVHGTEDSNDKNKR